MYNISSFWKNVSSKVNRPPPSKLDGWTNIAKTVDGFVEPTLRLVSGEPSSSKIFIVAAPGAVGKSTLAATLAAEMSYAFVDLAKTTPLGGNFFKGGLANAFGFDALPKAAAGEIGLIVDGLDEAQLRAAPAAFEAALIDLAEIVNNSASSPVVLFGRTLAAEETAIILELAGYNSCTFEIGFFNADQSERYIKSKCALLANRFEDTRRSYQNHGEVYHNLAGATRQKLVDVTGVEDDRFTGYAPVLDAICEFALDPNAENPSARLASLGSVNQVELLKSIADAVLIREQGKLLAQLRAERPQLNGHVTQDLYAPAEQRQRALAKVLRLPSPPLPLITDAQTREAYSEMVERFIGQHPFLNATSNGAANSVFSADLMVWSLLNKIEADAVRNELSKDSRLLTGAFFDLYINNLDAVPEDPKTPQKKLPLVDAGLLYQALQSRMSARQRALIDVTTGDDEEISISYETIDRDKPDSEDNHGPYKSDDTTVLELRAPFSHVYISAPIWVSLGDGISQQIGAPTEIECDELAISARQLFVHSLPEASGQPQYVTIGASACDGQSVKSISVSNVDFSVVWPDSKGHPWTSYSASPPPAPSPEIDFMRRRLRKILTAFRSHSKGSLVRFAKKVDGIRMTKGVIGANLLSALVNDGILSKTDGGKFYTLHQDIMSKLLNIDYHALQQQKYTAGVDAYLEEVLRR